MSPSTGIEELSQARPLALRLQRRITHPSFPSRSQTGGGMSDTSTFSRLRSRLRFACAFFTAALPVAALICQSSQSEYSGSSGFPPKLHTPPGKRATVQSFSSLAFSDQWKKMFRMPAAHASVTVDSANFVPILIFRSFCRFPRATRPGPLGQASAPGRT